MYSKEVIKGYFGLDVHEWLDDSMEIVHGITKTGHFHYVNQYPKFKVINTGNWNFNNAVYGIYENEKYVWTVDNLGGKRLYNKEELELM